MDKVMGTLFLFLTHTDSIYKQLVIWIKADKIEELLDIMRGKFIIFNLCHVTSNNIYVKIL